MVHMNGLGVSISNKIYGWFQYASILKICLTVIFLVLIAWAIAGIILWNIRTPQDNFPQLLITSFAAIVAVASLSVAAIGVLVTNRRQRRHETLKAYETWSDSTVEHFIQLSSHINPMEHMSDKQVGLLLSPKNALDGELKRILNCSNEEEVRAVLRSLRKILNGLERLAVGVYEGCYDEETLKRIAGSIIVDLRNRNSNYIEAVQEGRHGSKKNARAFAHLNMLADSIKVKLDAEKRVSSPANSHNNHRW